VEFPEEDREFILAFMRRTLDIVQKYSGPHDASVLLNCLLGLLVVPKERMLEYVPADPLDRLHEWGINPNVIKRGRCECGDPYPKTLRQLVKCMRHAIAHFDVRPINENKECVGFTLSNRSGFRVNLRVAEMHAFVERLAEHLKQAVGVA
jgi:hypothetical protein